MNIGESVVLNLTARYAAAFGIMAINNRINQAVVTRSENDYDVQVYDDYDPDFEAITLIYGIAENEVKLRFSQMLESDGNGSIYAPPMMINFSREKNLIETEVSGGDAVVVERWGTKPWNIEMRGILIDLHNRKYPTQKVEDLCRLFEVNDTLKVEGDQFVEKNISRIYLKDVSITPVEGYMDTVQFTLAASSINEVSFTLINPNS
ncbi:DUF6046 domain-containing protein [Chryseobacterium sp. CCH4-E10]|uniref:DUF6046 domain-containing protein n=1 Tax=Chryseobacterium sp. CCH4-E10 TaxID=1768758 RepID=UPI00082FBBA1|nr:DUF6046 domain-containing protein [Chryseobacterium sp. CCH4-E10]